MKHLISLLAIIVFSLTAIYATPHIKLARSQESNRIESTKAPEVVQVPVEQEKAIVEPVIVPPVVQPRSACDYIKDYDWDVRLMTAIAMAESGCVMQRGDGHLTSVVDGRTYGYSLGVLQVRILPGRERCDTEDPAVLMSCAYNIYKGQGLSAWTMYTNGRYLRFL